MSDGFLQRFYSAFPGATMLTRLGNGTISEVGGVLTLSCGSGVNCSAWALNPYAYRPLPSQAFAFDTVLKIETRLYSCTTSVVAGMGLSIFQDSNNAYLTQFYAGDSRIYISRIYGGSGGNLANTGAVAAPGTSPHTYRVYFNPTARALFIQESDGFSLTINANEVQFWYRVGDAGTWTLLHSRTMEWSINGLSAGPFSYTGSPWPATTALYSHFGVYQWDAEMQRMLPLNNRVSFS